MSNNRSPAVCPGGVSEGSHAAKQITPEITPSSPRLQRRKPLLHHEYLLGEIRLASAHAALWQNQLNVVGVALKAHLISPETAVAELRDCPFFRPIVDAPVIADVEGGK
jgi:hypothetical protein